VSDTPECCPRCGLVDLVTVRCFTGPHYARVTCPGCQRHVCWLPHPMTKERADEFVMPYGKFAGSKLSEILATDRGGSYLRWILDNTDPRPTVRRAIERALGLKGDTDAA
jgi:hypothetical protein